MTDPRTPAQLEQAGKASFERQDYLAAAELFEAAQQGFLAAGDTLNAAEMANNACVAYVGGENGAKALQVIEGIEAVFEAAGDVRRQGMTLGNRGSALEELERNEEALKDYFRAAELLAQVGEDQMRAQVLSAASRLQFSLGKQLQALVSMNQGLEGVKKPNARQRFMKRLLTIPMDMLRKKSS